MHRAADLQERLQQLRAGHLGYVSTTVEGFAEVLALAVQAGYGEQSAVQGLVTEQVWLKHGAALQRLVPEAVARMRGMEREEAVVKAREALHVSFSNCWTADATPASAPATKFARSKRPGVLGVNADGVWFGPKGTEVYSKPRWSAHTKAIHRLLWSSIQFVGHSAGTLFIVTTTGRRLAFTSSQAPALHLHINSFIQ